MFDKFSRRNNYLTEHSVPGEIIRQEANNVMDAQFATNPNYHVGMLYDWQMNPIKEVEFLFHKVRDRTAEGKEVFYQVQFRPGFYPEYEYKDLYYRKDGRERFGFYLDIEDPFKGRGYMEKWLIMNKDQKVEFDRYNAFKCNWCFEWIYDGEYYVALGCVREAVDNSFGDNGKIDKIGGSIVNGEMSLILPVTPETRTILLGQKFIISDNTLNPQTYEVTTIKDSSPLGIMRAFLKQKMFNRHTDYYGIINDERSIDFTFDLPIPDLPDGYGGPYHAICDCIKTKGLPVKDITEEIQYKLYCSTNKIVVKGSPVYVELVSAVPENSRNWKWRYMIDGQDYSKEELKNYFEIKEQGSAAEIRCINDDMVKFILTVLVDDEYNNQSNVIDLEVKS